MIGLVGSTDVYSRYCTKMLRNETIKKVTIAHVIILTDMTDLLVLCKGTVRIDPVKTPVEYLHQVN